MFNTICYKNGVIQIKYLDQKEVIEVWINYEKIGDHYRSVAGARSAITQIHNRDRALANFEHNQIIKRIRS